MGMEVIGYLAHHPVDRELLVSETGRGDASEFLQHVLDLVLGRRRAVLAPHDHRHVTHLAVGDPADVVLVVPRRHSGRLAQLARHGHASSAARSVATCRPTASGPSPSSTRRMSADATTTPSAGAAAATACSTVEMPKPITTGSVVAAFKRLARTAADSASERRS